MKALALLPFILLTCCQPEKKFDFLVGEWTRTNEEAGEQTIETWKRLNDSTYIGHSYILSGKDTVWREKAILSPIAGVWHYQVRLMEEIEAINFRVVEADGRSFICENQHNAFPKVIKYWKDGENLQAEVSYNDSSVAYLFARKQEVQ